MVHGVAMQDLLPSAGVLLPEDGHGGGHHHEGGGGIARVRAFHLTNTETSLHKIYILIHVQTQIYNGYKCIH